MPQTITVIAKQDYEIFCHFQDFAGPMGTMEICIVHFYSFQKKRFVHIFSTDMSKSRNKSLAKV